MWHTGNQMLQIPPSSSPVWHSTSTLSALARFITTTPVWSHSPHTHTHTHTLVHSRVPPLYTHTHTHTHTLSLTSHTQTKQCYLAAVLLLMRRECWSQFFSHTQWTYVSQKQGRLCIPSSELKKKKVCFSFNTPLLKSPQTGVERPWAIRGGDLVASVCACACSNVFKRARACDYKGRIWDALGKTNTDSDRCQQHLSDLHFLIANELPKKHFTSTDRQRDTQTSSTWRRKCFHRNIYRRLRKLPHEPAAPLKSVWMYVGMQMHMYVYIY